MGERLSCPFRGNPPKNKLERREGESLYFPVFQMCEYINFFARLTLGQPAVLSQIGHSRRGADSWLSQKVYWYYSYSTS